MVPRHLQLLSRLRLVAVRRACLGLHLNANLPSTSAAVSSNSNHLNLNLTGEGIVRKLHTSSSNFNEQKDEKQQKQEEEEDAEKFKRQVQVLGSMALTLGFSWALYSSLFGNEDYDPGATEISWNQFVHQLLSKGEVTRIEVYPPSRAERGASAVAVIYPFKDAIIDNKPLYMHNPQGFYRMNLQDVVKFEQQLRHAEDELGIPLAGRVPVVYRNVDTQNAITSLIIALALFSVVFMLFNKVMGSSGLKAMGNPFESMTKARYKLVDPHGMDSKTSKIKFKDVAGLHEAKVEIQEFVDYLKRPQAYTKLGAKLPKGALLHGPPGCGKTLLAKAVASEASVPFLAMNGTEFIEMIGGVGASRVRQLFADAKKRAPCIIYIDEIDAIGKKRSSGNNMGGDSESDQTLNQLLVELDGMDSAQGIVTLCSTNRADVLDKALMRRGRLDRHVTIDTPTLLERKEIFELYLDKIKIDPVVKEKTRMLAQMTPGFTGADINNLCNEAAIRAATNRTETTKFVTEEDLDYALEKVIAGSVKRSSAISLEEKEVVAYHESGHALVGWLLKYTDALVRVSIIPRTGAALGFARYSPADRKLFSKEELFDRMCMTLGGRAAENITFGRITTGAQNDLQKVTELAFAQVRIYGMDEDIGPLSFVPSAGDERQSQFMVKPYSDMLANQMDIAAMQLVGQCYRNTEELLEANKDKLKTLAEALLKNEVLSYEDVSNLIGPPQFGHKNTVEVVEQVLPEPPKPEEE